MRIFRARHHVILGPSGLLSMTAMPAHPDLPVAGSG